MDLSTRHVHLDFHTSPDIDGIGREEFVRAEGGSNKQQKVTGRSDFGVVRMLQELGHEFDLISSDRDLTPYKLIVLPDSIPVDEASVKKLRAHVGSGGTLVLSHQSGLTSARDRFADAELFGVEYVGDAGFQPDVLHPEPALREGLADTRSVMAQRARPDPDRPRPEAGQERDARARRGRARPDQGRQGGAVHRAEARRPPDRRAVLRLIEPLAVIPS